MRLVIALMRHDLRLADNPIINALSHAEVQHFIPLFVCRPLHLDIQGFVKDGGEKSLLLQLRALGSANLGVAVHFVHNSW